MFGALFSNPTGAEYNVPFRDIRPQQNQVNIDSGQGNQGNAYDAFSRYWLPMLQNQSQLAQSMGARNIDASGAPIQGPEGLSPTPQAGDFNAGLHDMFQRAQDQGTLSRYHGFSPQTRRTY